MLTLAPLVLVASLVGVVDGSLGHAAAGLTKLGGTGLQLTNSVSPTNHATQQRNAIFLGATCGRANTIASCAASAMLL